LADNSFSNSLLVLGLKAAIVAVSPQATPKLQHRSFIIHPLLVAGSLFHSFFPPRFLKSSALSANEANLANER
jgi:hypothetical protein